jgi:hypothetical protein
MVLQVDDDDADEVDEDEAVPADNSPAEEIVKQQGASKSVKMVAGGVFTHTCREGPSSTSPNVSHTPSCQQ